MRRWWFGMGWVVAAALCVVPARACLMCSSSLVCVWSPNGATWCIAGNSLCMLGGACGGKGSIDGLFDGDLPEMQFSIVEPPAGSSLTSARVATGVGPVSTGRQALRIAQVDRGAAGYDALVFTGHGVAGPGTAVFSTPAGDGFALSIQGEGRGAHVRVSALLGRGPGRPLADEHLRGDDALVVSVPFEGRPRLLVLQASVLTRPERERLDEDAAREVRESSFGQPQPTRPPFELRVLDR
jgi:hypothetical protein